VPLLLYISQCRAASSAAALARPWSNFACAPASCIAAADTCHSVLLFALYFFKSFCEAMIKIRREIATIADTLHYVLLPLSFHPYP
jgi:hypothetical protein